MEGDKRRRVEVAAASILHIDDLPFFVSEITFSLPRCASLPPSLFSPRFMFTFARAFSTSSVALEKTSIISRDISQRNCRESIDKK